MYTINKLCVHVFICLCIAKYTEIYITRENVSRNSGIYRPIFVLLFLLDS